MNQTEHTSMIQLLSVQITGDVDGAVLTKSTPEEILSPKIPVNPDNTTVIPAPSTDTIPNLQTKTEL